MFREKGGYVYIMTNKNNTVLYTGVTSHLTRRASEHKEHLYPGSFTAKYNISKLVYYEHFKDIQSAIKREKQIKAGSRKAKTDLINAMNPDWIDLYHSICGL
jgi:putative endonuclease